MESNKTGFFSRLFGGKKPKEVVEEPEINEADAPTVAETIPTTILEFTPEQEEAFTEAEKKQFRKFVEELPPLRLGEINFVPFDLGHIEGGVFVRVIIRNGRDLLEEFTLEPMVIGLVDANLDVVARGFFRPEDFGSIRFGEARLWTLAWRSSEFIKENPDLSGYTLSFE